MLTFDLYKHSAILKLFVSTLNVNQKFQTSVCGASGGVSYQTFERTNVNEER